MVQKKMSTSSGGANLENVNNIQQLRVPLDPQLDNFDVKATQRSQNHSKLQESSLLVRTLQLKQDAGNIEGHSCDLRKDAAGQEKNRQHQLNIKEQQITGQMEEPGSGEHGANAVSSPNITNRNITTYRRVEETERFVKLTARQLDTGPVASIDCDLERAQQ